MGKDRIDVRIGSLSPAARAALEAAPRRSAWVRAALEHFAVCQAPAGGVGPALNFEAGVLRAAVEEAVRPLAERIAALEEAVLRLSSPMAAVPGAVPPASAAQQAEGRREKGNGAALEALSRWADEDA